jgi:hypothetical protein
MNKTPAVGRRKFLGWIGGAAVSLPFWPHAIFTGSGTACSATQESRP